MPLSHYALDTFVAPDLSSLTTCGMRQIEFPDVPFAGVVLNQIFAKPRPPEKIRLLTNLFRWIDAAFVSYATAREYLTAYTSIPRGEMRNYFRALWYIEQCIAATDHAGMLGHNLWGPSGEKYYEPDKGHPRERLRVLYNASKHIDGMIRKRGGLQADATIPIWFTNDRIESKNHHLTFNELAAFMHDFVTMLQREFPDIPVGASSEKTVPSQG
jgi:hypothetical protein